MKFNLYIVFIVFESFKKRVRRGYRSNKGFINILALSDVKFKYILSITTSIETFEIYKQIDFCLHFEKFKFKITKN